MNPQDPSLFILTNNGGSSSITFALFRDADLPVPVTRGMVDRIGLPDCVMVVTDVLTQQSERHTLNTSTHQACAGSLMEWLEQDVGSENLRTVAHRVVHGGQNYGRPEYVTRDMVAELRRISPYDPEHMPAEIGLIEAFGARYPKVPQVACFDTAFHGDMPQVARLLPIPKRYEKLDLQRYGFHA